MPPSVLQIFPDDKLCFVHQPDARTQSSLSLKNISHAPVAFKIKVTSLKSYGVRPTFGVIEAGCDQKVVITLHVAPPQLQTIKDRFLILATPVSPNADVSDKNFWRTVDKDHIQEYKLAAIVRTDMDEKLAKAAEYCLALEEKNKKLDAELSMLVEKQNARSGGQAQEQKPVQQSLKIELWVILMLFGACSYLLFGPRGGLWTSLVGGL